MRVSRWPPALLAMIRNAAGPPTAPVTGISVVSTLSTTASAGGCSTSSLRNFRTEAWSPSASSSTPEESFPTCPASPSEPASPCTNGRNPTPCTMPVTRTRTRTRVVICSCQASAAGERELHELPEHVIGGRLGLLDAVHRVRRHDEQVVDLAPGGRLGHGAPGVAGQPDGEHADP